MPLRQRSDAHGIDWVLRVVQLPLYKLLKDWWKGCDHGYECTPGNRADKADL